MKNNSGVTLVALIVIIVLLIIFSSAAIYTSLNSYKLIDLQKYKTQMQAIQSAVDEFYEEYQNEYKKIESLVQWNNELTEEDKMKLFVYYKAESSIGTFKDYYTDITGISTIEGLERIDEATDTINWWDNIADKYGIFKDEPSVQKQYYRVSKAKIKQILDLKDIDVSEYFIINFQKRYVFSETPINVSYVNESDEDTSKDIYCLYELNDEEKVVEFKVDSNVGLLDIDIIEKTLYYQIARIRLTGPDAIIKKIYCIEGIGKEFEDENTELPTVESLKQYFQEVTGLGTDEVFIKIKAEPISLGTQENGFMFVAEDMFGGTQSKSIAIKLHEPPVLENNMIPFIASDNKEKGIVYPTKQGSDDINEWYDYSSGRYATVVISNMNEEDYQKRQGMSFDITQGTSYTLPNGSGGGTHIVKVWIPKKLASELLGDNYNSTDFINKTGIWVTAEWNGTKWVPDEKKTLTVTVDSFSNDELTINLSTGISNMKYYWKINDMDNESYKSDSGTVHGTVSANYANNQLVLTDSNADILQNIRSVSIYGIAPNGNSTPIRTIQLKEEEISNLIKNGSFESGFDEWTLNGATGGGHEISNMYSLYGRYSFKKPATEPVPYNYITQVPGFKVDKNYYVSIHAYNPSNTESNVNFDIGNAGYGVGKSINVESGWTKLSLIYPSDGVDRNVAINYTNTTVDTYIDEVSVVNLTEILSNNKYNAQNNKEWCDTFIETKNGKTILYYYE